MSDYNWLVDQYHMYEGLLYKATCIVVGCDAIVAC